MANHNLKWQEIVRGLISLILVTLAGTLLPLYAVNERPPDTVFWIGIALIVSVAGAYGIDIVINRKRS